jgi:uncharacterized protein (DUF2249 family)
MTVIDAPLDVRRIPPPERHPVIFGTFDHLAVGESFEIVNDHDPVPLYFQFERTRSGQFAWEYLESGPARWHVRISRQADGPAGAATGGCGGGCACSGG